MVIMPVTEYNRIDSRQVNVQHFRILYNCVSLPCVEQEFMLFSLSIDAQSMLCNTVFITAGIFYKCDDLHS